MEEQRRAPSGAEKNESRIVMIDGELINVAAVHAAK